jgi:cell division protein FtsB
VKASRIAVVLVGAGGLAFGFGGGEYGTLDLWSLQRQIRQEREAIRRLRVELDSLRRLAEALESDPATQERVAREAFGMLRPGEILYRVESVKP